MSNRGLHCGDRMARNPCISLCVICGLSLMIAVHLEAAPLGQVKNSSASALNQAEQHWLIKEYDLARAQLQRFETRERSSAGRDEVERCLGLWYRIANSEYMAAPKEASRLGEFTKRYRDLRDYHLVECRQFADNRKAEATAEALQHYQGLIRHYVGSLQKVGAYANAVEEVTAADKVYASVAPLLQEHAQAVVQEPTGAVGERVVTLSEKYGLDNSRGLAVWRIILCRQRHATEPTADSRKALIQAYDNFIKHYRTYAIAGTYLQDKMELEGRVDLDALLAVYRDCEEKNSTQYQGSVLGLANLLCDNKRPVEALALYKQVDMENIPSSRVAELHYGLGNAYLANGFSREALDEFLVVKRLTDRFADVPGLIAKITGMSEAEFNRMLNERVAALPEQKAGASREKSEVTTSTGVAASAPTTQDIELLSNVPKPQGDGNWSTTTVAILGIGVIALAVGATALTIKLRKGVS